jgi:AcrR family transcriptional regulator
MSPRSERPAGKGVGRPRSPHVEAAILDATLEILADGGYGGLTIEAVAARAGVSKAAIYRRWPSREEMVAAAFRSATTTFEPPGSGNVRGDLVALLTSFQRSPLRALPGHLIPQLIASTVSSPELMQVFLANVYAPRRGALIAVLERGVDRGELRPGLDLNLCVSMVVGPALHTALLDVDALSSDLPVRIVDTLLSGIRQPAGRGRRPRTTAPGSRPG